VDVAWLLFDGEGVVVKEDPGEGVPWKPIDVEAMAEMLGE
jgi:hypothetical protein